MDINTILTLPIRVFSLPPEVLLVIIPRKKFVKSSAKLISEPEITNKVKDSVFFKQNEDNIRPTCLVCGITFENVELQRTHYKLDWHRFNVKRRAASLELGKKQYIPTTEEEFEELMGDSISSISGSGTDCSDTTEDDVATLVNELKETNLYNDELTERKNNNSEPISWYICPNLFPTSINLGIYKNILYNFGDNDIDDIYKLQVKPNEKQNPRLWAMIMIGGGHFAALILDVTKNTNVFHAKEVKAIVHKTFHRYTTRRKQGGSQTSNDNAKGKAKSAGADLRRYNEAALQKDIRALIGQWKSMIEESELIFVHAPSANKNIIYNYEESVLKKDDKRIRSFPFSTKRPTFTELRRSYIELTRIKVLEVKESNDDNGIQETIKSKLTEENLKRSQIITETMELAKSNESSDILEKASNETIKMYNLIKKGKLDLFVNHITKNSFNVTDLLPITPISENDISKIPTLLHLASSLGQHDIIEYLLNQGADPTITSIKNLTPYDLAKDKETRNVFRRYMAEHMDKWNWINAHVPSPLTKEMEEEQLRKQKEKKRKDKERKKKATANKKEKEIIEVNKKAIAESSESISSASKKNGSSMTGKSLDNSSSLIGLPAEMRTRIERERRARAAEARLNGMQNRGAPKPLTLPSIGNVVCNMCEKSLSGLVPFEICELKFCSTVCVKNYRDREST
ncbi:14514_t:CDS:2 [Funneliformis geosporum]|uniref:10424_t:CDS:1 n=1 Tax=Funneliformis geosporum TaxID=1117311 RepID=A0A9W4SL93_9GLOM|nr:14514_t:CDS:2 [Funneliformis geosporum]CAI2172551.1 10424_t:CDS:2 [Funneliformis geosporum]